MTDEWRVSSDDKLDTRKVIREPKPDPPLPCGVQVRVDLIDKYNTAVIHDDTSARFLNKQPPMAETLCHLPDEFKSEREHRPETIGKRGNRHGSAIAVGKMNVIGIDLFKANPVGKKTWLIDEVTHLLKQVPIGFAFQLAKVKVAQPYEAF